jgi:Flp pilus assembly protein TadD
MDPVEGGIVFLSVPESLRGKIETADHGESSFAIDPAIPIPVELRPGESSLNLEELSWEMILSGMLRIISSAPPDIGAEDIDYYRRFVLTLKPAILHEFTEAAILKAKNGDHDPALEINAALRGLFPESPVVILNQALFLEEKAEALERAGQEAAAAETGERARRAYLEAMALSPAYPNAFFNAGFFFMKRRDFAEARDCFIRFLAEGENDEKGERARELLGEIRSRGLDNEHFREAWEALRQGDLEQGLGEIRLFLEGHPEVWNGWFLLGWALRRLSRWEDAAASFKKTIELGGGNSDTRNELAICLMETGDLGGARRELETALREEPDNVKIISNLAVTALKGGDRERAAAFFRTVLELEPEDPIAGAFFGEDAPRRAGF